MAVLRQSRRELVAAARYRNMPLMTASNTGTNWVAVDWGSTNVRAFLLDDAGAVQAQTSAALGSKHTRREAYRGVLQDLLDTLGSRPDRVLLAGMVGSRAGWLEAPYCACPAGVAELAADAVAVPEWPGARIVPGLSCRRASGSGDVIRGEEVQCVGAIHLQPGVASVCLPGTHSKWVRIRTGRLIEFTTYCTGELFDAVRHHTLIGALIPDGQVAGHEPGEGFALGLRRATDEPGVLSALFSVRADVLLGGIAPEQAEDYLSGILIGAELREARDAGMLESVSLIADGNLAARYVTALREFGAAVHEIASEEAFVVGAATISGHVDWRT